MKENKKYYSKEVPSPCNFFHGVLCKMRGMDIFMTGQTDYIILKSSRLTVEIAKPGSVYTRTRFDRTGFITQVTLDGINTFCAKESDIPGEGTGGMGLCNEFGIETALGYKEAALGEYFSKIGVGMLRKFPDERYKFWVDYEVNPYPVQVSLNESSAEFVSEPLDCNGYAVRLIKRVSVDGNLLQIDYRLENTGSKRVETNEYCHNFIRINDYKLGEGYSLNFPFDIKPDKEPHIVTFNKRSIVWEKTPSEEFYHAIEGYTENMSFQWELVYKPTGVGVRETSNLQASKLALWGRAHVVSPEVFFDIRLEPGETVEWIRKYEFFD